MNKPTPEKLSLTLTRIIRAPRPRVFAAFSSVEEMKKWFGPGECHVIEGEMDFRPGGRYRLHMHTTSFGVADLTGAYREIISNQLIRSSWSWRNNATMEPWGEMQVIIRFSDHPDGTQVTLTHEGLMNDEVREGHSHGWNGSFDKLEGCSTGKCGA